jgi:cytoplasmic iron level regulating protein YaaA (DUF328/UPF0246 family)
VLVLPPSEGKAPGGVGGWSPDQGAFGTELGAARLAIIDALRASDGGDQRMLGVAGAHLERARNANLGLLGAATLPAWQRYRGVVWEHLDPAGLPAAARRRIVVVSGLLGLVRADDPVPDYRLKMGARLAPMGLVSRWWNPTLSNALVRLSKRRFVIDMLANEQRSAIAAPPGRGVTVRLFERSGNSGGHGAKAAKGRLARHLLAAASGGADDPLSELVELLGSWHDEQYVAEFEVW